jgi:polyisoprenyl-phosphate glycosyltransferase
VSVPGSTATIVVIIFFGSFNMIGLGIIGSYVWRAYDTVKGRPGAIVRDVMEFPARDDADG